MDGRAESERNDTLPCSAQDHEHICDSPAGWKVVEWIVSKRDTEGGVLYVAACGKFIFSQIGLVYWVYLGIIL